MAQQCTYLSHLTSSSRAGGTAVPQTRHVKEDGLPRLTSRYARQNSNTPLVGAIVRSGFIAVIGPATGEFFSANSCPSGYFGAKPNARSKRLA
jgi:hypothetical protein